MKRDIKFIDKVVGWMQGRAIKPMRIQRNKVYHSLEDARSIGIVVNLAEKRSEEAYRYLTSHFRKLGIKSSGIFINIEKNAPSCAWCLAVPHSTIITRTDINKLGVPSESLIKDFCEGTFDILINLSTVYNFTADCIMVHTGADMTVGTHVSDAMRYDLEIFDAPKEGEIKDVEDEELYYEDEEDDPEDTVPEEPTFTTVDLATEIIRYLSAIKVEK